MSVPERIQDCASHWAACEDARPEQLGWEDCAHGMACLKDSGHSLMIAAFVVLFEVIVALRVAPLGSLRPRHDRRNLI